MSEERITALEKQLAGLRDDIEGLRAAVQAFITVQKDVNRVNAEVRHLSQLVQNYFNEQDKLHERIARELRGILGA